MTSSLLELLVAAKKLVKIKLNKKMAKDENLTDPERDFQEEKLKMSYGKASMTKKIKRLENALTDFKELDLMDLPNKDMQEAAREVDECRSAVKEAYTKMETINEQLTKKLILLDRTGNVPDAEKSLAELTNALEE